MQVRIVSNPPFHPSNGGDAHNFWGTVEICSATGATTEMDTNDSCVALPTVVLGVFCDLTISSFNASGQIPDFLRVGSGSECPSCVGLLWDRVWDARGNLDCVPACRRILVMRMEWGYIVAWIEM